MRDHFNLCGSPSMKCHTKSRLKKSKGIRKLDTFQTHLHMCIVLRSCNIGQGECFEVGTIVKSGLGCPISTSLVLHGWNERCKICKNEKCIKSTIDKHIHVFASRDLLVLLTKFHIYIYIYCMYYTVYLYRLQLEHKNCIQLMLQLQHNNVGWVIDL